MRHAIKLLLCTLVFGMAMPGDGMAQKKKKEKKPFVWEMPALTGDKDFDNYLKLCDSLWYVVKQYSENITFYQMRPVVITEDGQEVDRQWCMVDTATNTLRSSGEAFKQDMDIILAYPDLMLDMTNLSLATTLAGTSLPGLDGLKAIAYAKYLKAGPILVGEGGKQMKKIYKLARKQATQIKDLKAGKVDDDYARNAEVEASSVDAGEASMNVLISSKPVYMEKATFEQQNGAIQKQDEENPVSDEELPEELI